MKKIGKIILCGCGGLFLLGTVFVCFIAFQMLSEADYREYRASVRAYHARHQLREASQGEFLTVLNLPFPDIKGDYIDFYWVDDNVIAYRINESMNNGNNVPFSIINLINLEKYESATLPKIKAWDDSRFDKSEVRGGELSCDNGRTVTMYMARKWYQDEEDFKRGGKKCSCDNGLCLMTKEETILVTKGHINFFNVSPDGCQAIVNWRKRENDLDSVSQIGLLKFCKHKEKE